LTPRSVSAARLFSVNSEVEKLSFMLIVTLVIENPFHALVRNSSGNGLLTQRVVVRLAVTALSPGFYTQIEERAAQPGSAPP
jgi:hypothetical protein